MADEAQGSAAQVDVVRALRDAAWAGLIAFGGFVRGGWY